jgi:hypothetical protein
MSKACSLLHAYCNSLPRHTAPFKDGTIPSNGIYIMFERGEKAHGQDRIVRIGTHTGDNQLESRLLQHTTSENKDRSIFRKNIGRALLNREHDDFLKYWEHDLTSRSNHERYYNPSLLAKQREVEQRVSAYIHERCSFVVLPVPRAEDRLHQESQYIATVAACSDCQPSSEWLGQYSPKEKIRTYGLWLVNGLTHTPLSDNEATLLFH